MYTIMLFDLPGMSRRVQSAMRENKAPNKLHDGRWQQVLLALVPYSPCVCGVYVTADISLSPPRGKSINQLSSALSFLSGMHLVRKFYTKRTPGGKAPSGVVEEDTF